MSIFISFHAIICELARSQPAKPRKWNLTRNSQSGHSTSCILGSLKSRRWTIYRHIITLPSSLRYPEKIAENCRSRQIHCRLTPPPREPPRYRQKLESLAYIYAADSMGLSSFKFLWWVRKTHFSATECIYAVQGHPRSLILAPIERVSNATSY